MSTHLARTNRQARLLLFLQLDRASYMTTSLSVSSRCIASMNFSSVSDAPAGDVIVYRGVGLGTHVGGALAPGHPSTRPVRHGRARPRRPRLLSLVRGREVMRAWPRAAAWAPWPHAQIVRGELRRPWVASSCRSSCCACVTVLVPARILMGDLPASFGRRSVTCR